MMGNSKTRKISFLQQFLLFAMVQAAFENNSRHLTTTQTVCGVGDGTTQSNSPVVVTCQTNSFISEITFASFGSPSGECGTFQTSQEPECDAPLSLASVKASCVGKATCTVQSSNANFGNYNLCSNPVPVLQIQAVSS